MLNLMLRLGQFRIEEQSLFWRGAFAVSMVSAALSVLVFLYYAGGAMRLRSLRLFSATMASSATFIAIAFFPEFEQTARALFGLDGEQDLGAIMTMLAVLSLFSFSAYFFSVIIDGLWPPGRGGGLKVVLGGEGSKVVSSSSNDGLEPLFQFLSVIPSLFGRVFLSLRYGLLALLAFVIVLANHGDPLALFFSRLTTIVILEIDGVVASENVNWLLNFCMGVLDEILSKA